MLNFPLHNAAQDLKGKPPCELPHGLLAFPPEVYELVERQRSRHRPEVFEGARVSMLNSETIAWYFDSLYHEVMYRETPDGPEVLAVGFDEVLALRRAQSLEDRRNLKSYLGY